MAFKDFYRKNKLIAYILIFILVSIIGFYYFKNEFANSLTYFHILLAVDPDNVRAHHELGRLYSRLERYEEAEEFLKQAIDKADEIEAELALRKTLEKSEQENIIAFFQTYWLYIVVFISGSLIIAVLVYKKTEPRRIAKRIKSLEKEKSVIEGLIRKIQKKYFEEYTIPKSEYNISMSKYQQRLGKIKKDVRLLTDKKK